MDENSEDKAKQRADMYRAAGIHDRFHGLHLSQNFGKEGVQMRSYLKTHYRSHRDQGLSLLVRYSVPALPVVFAKELILLNDRVEFSYMQSIAERILEHRNMAGQATVIDWFEGDGECPWTAKERYRIETELIGMLDIGCRLYLFARAMKTPCTWWSTQFYENFASYGQTLNITGGRDAGIARNQEISFGGDPDEGQERPIKRRGVTIR